MKKATTSTPLSLGSASIGIGLVLGALWIRFFPVPQWLAMPHVQLLAFFVLGSITGYSWFLLRERCHPRPVVPDRVRQALDTLSEGLLVLDEHESIVLANQAFARTVDVSQQDLVGRSVGSLPWEYSCVEVRQSMPWTRVLKHNAAQSDQLIRYRMSDGTFRVFSINSSPIESSDARGTLNTIRDVTHIEEHRAELEQMLAMLRTSRDKIRSKNQELEVLANQDALTRCLNRRSLLEGFESVWSDHDSQTHPIACLMIDNDHFKQVNDSYGHQVGDEVLRRVSSVIRDRVPEPSLVCRYGGEEFCVVVPSLSARRAADLAEDVRHAVESLRFEPVPGLRVAVSIGVSTSDLGASDPQELINQADKCLYVAKGRGRNQVVTYSRHAVESVRFPSDRTDDRQPVASDESPADQRVRAESARIPFQAVMALVSALAYRDSETTAHSRRVADLCGRLASGLLRPGDDDLLHDTQLLMNVCRATQDRFLGDDQDASQSPPPPAA